jgi:Holliday junction DNA helicase RuvA
MIGKLTGTVDGRGADSLILDVNGVGYVVHCSPRTMARLPGGGQRVSLAVETQMREDMIRLFGFDSESERDWFRLLQSVQGVGSKVALAILGVLPGDELGLAIARGDRTAVSRAPGVGPKLAARIVAELKDKAGSLEFAGEPTLESTGVTRTAGPAEDAVSALVNLGYPRLQAMDAVAAATAQLGGDAAAPALIRQGLKRLSG